jgi:hypothetical protein
MMINIDSSYKVPVTQGLSQLEITGFTEKNEKLFNFIFINYLIINFIFYLYINVIYIILIKILFYYKFKFF